MSERRITVTDFADFGKTDPISPQHYAQYVIQPFDFITKNRIPFAEGNVIKYVVRWRNKNGVEDLKKAREYLNRLIASVEAGDVAK